LPNLPHEIVKSVSDKANTIIFFISYLLKQ
jgi:hypothetical protein